MLAYEEFITGDAQRREALRCGGIPRSIILKLLLKFNNITIVQQIFISHHIVKSMLCDRAI
jgi:hypothetical protein